MSLESFQKVWMHPHALVAPVNRISFRTVKSGDVQRMKRRTARVATHEKVASSGERPRALEVF